jgi:hypothetical protein
MMSRKQEVAMPTKQTTVQTLIFDKEKFRTESEVRRWVKEHGFRVLQSKEEITKPGIDETRNTWRVRQRPPTDFVPGSFKTIQLTEGVKAVIGRLKERKTAAEEALDLLHLTGATDADERR